ncbi:MAG: FHA domain-containing protein [Propionibacteriaceae bacterium]|jgi:hypothetical protein|nr:FHA domain-containing protein [Propionibacteriaceae bacterium]
MVDLITQNNPGFSYQPGPYALVCVPSAAVLIELPTGHELVGQVYAALRAKVDLDDVLDILISSGLRAVRGFVAVAGVPVGARVIARGSFRAVDGQGEEVNGLPIITDRFTDDFNLRLDAGDTGKGSESSDWLPLLGGVVNASVVQIGTVEPPFDDNDDEGETVIEPLPPAPEPIDDDGPATAEQPVIEAELLDAAEEPEAEAAPFSPESPDQAESAEEPDSDSDDPVRQPVMIMAVSCPDGHLTSPYLNMCRVCGQPVSPQRPVEVPRPPLGTILFANGDRELLDCPIILGRSPRVPPDYAGEQPKLLQLDDPGRDVSGQHLQIGIDGWQVLLTDLGSTNGTEVVFPGAQPVRLRPNDPLLIGSGTYVVLGGSLEFWYETGP